MNTVLEDLWYGNIQPHKQHMDNNQTDTYMQRKLAQTYNALTAISTSQQKELLEAYKSHFTAYQNHRDLSAFEYGFRLGMQLALAITNN